MANDKVESFSTHYSLLSLSPSFLIATVLSLSLSLSFFILFTFHVSTPQLFMANRWLRPEVYPLFAAVGAAIGICGFQLVRNICINPEVRVNKEGRKAGVLENFAEGEKYAEHFLRKYVRNRAPEIMPSINSFFADTSRN
ncbi:hypothetical protein VNO78_02954 [Psophocarpus tetragonolobus]|uniref:NADH-ubiquinone reductase complex 1 MLRQ subunit n=1 Tax=Psophocarpus tetragonolobus TaxID=3891 RepID=A0AAN9T174_PSOTE